MSDDERKARKMKGKQILTTALAGVATVHAAHGVYESIEKRAVRQKAVKEGRLSAEEASKLKKKAMLQDAAAIGLAALGVKGAIHEMKEAKHMSKEVKEFKAEIARRRERRLETRKRLSQSQSGERRRADSWSTSDRRPYDDYDSDDDYTGPRYWDGNPYRSNPPPDTSGGGGYR